MYFFMVATNGLIGAANAPLGDYFLGNILEIFLEKVFKKKFKIYIFKCHYFVNICVKHLAKICHFQSFPSPFIVLLKVQMLMK